MAAPRWLGSGNITTYPLQWPAQAVGTLSLGEMLFHLWAYKDLKHCRHPASDADTGPAWGTLPGLRSLLHHSRCKKTAIYHVSPAPSQRSATRAAISRNRVFRG